MIGRRTISGLAASLIPSRLTMLVAALALLAAITLHVLASFAIRANVTGAAKALQIASTLEAMPVWLILGGVMTQFASRLLTAWDDARAWREQRRMVDQIELEELQRAATDGLPVDVRRLRGE